MSIWKKITHSYLKWRYFQRAKHPYLYKYKEVEITIFPTVFSPKGTITTELFASYLIDQEWKGKSALELGAGSGILSFLLANRGANISASDISEAAIQGLIDNNKKQENKIEIINSDLFENVESKYDFIIVNPPFFAKNPSNTTEKAWYCGENFEYFESLFAQFKLRNNHDEKLLMILSENADIVSILQLAKQSNLIVTSTYEAVSKKEAHKIFSIEISQ